MRHLFAFLTVLGLLLAFGCENVTAPSSDVLDSGEDELTRREAVVASERIEVEQERRAYEKRIAEYRVVLAKRSADALFQGSKITVPDDYPTIQAAVNAASPGTKIKVKEGSYDEQVTVMTADLRITAEGDVSVEQGFLISSTSGVEIENMTINRTTGVSTEQDAVVVMDCSEITIQDNVIHGGSDGIWMVNTSESLIKGNDITAVRDQGVDLYDGCEDNVIEENTVVAEEEAVELDKLCNNNEIANNTVTSNGDDVIDLANSHNNEIVENTIHSLYDDGVELIDGSSGNEITENIIIDSESDGIIIEYSSNNRLTDNLVENADDNGVEFLGDSANNTFGSGNIVKDNNDKGLLLARDTVNNTIKKNTICGSGNADVVDRGASNTFKDNETGACN